jgi:hypothetical protein
VTRAALALALALAAAAPAAAQTRTALPLGGAASGVVPEVSWYRVSRDGEPVGYARFAYSLVDPPAAQPPAIEFRGEVEQTVAGVRQVQRSRWTFDARLQIVSFEEVLEAGAERRTLRGEAQGELVREVFEIPGLPPRTLECAVPPGAIARYAVNLALLRPDLLSDGRVYVYRQLSPRSGQFATVTTAVRRDDDGRVRLETTSDEAPGLVVRSEVLPRSQEHPNGCTLRSVQEGPGVRVEIVKASEAEAREAARAARDRGR